MGVTLGEINIHVIIPQNISFIMRSLFLSVCTMVNAALSTVEHIHVIQNLEHSGALYPPNTLRAILFIPLIATNVLATASICSKAWCVFLLRVYE
jgi:hypothetical protein